MLFSYRRTDFRELVRDLFGFFKTRIWMQKISIAQAAALKLLSPFMPKMNPSHLGSSSQEYTGPNDYAAMEYPGRGSYGSEDMSKGYDEYENAHDGGHYSNIHASYPSSSPTTPKYYTGGNMVTGGDEYLDQYGAAPQLGRVLHHGARDESMHRQKVNMQAQQQSRSLPRDEKFYGRQETYPSDNRQMKPVDSRGNPWPSHHTEHFRGVGAPPSDYTYMTQGPPGSDGAPSYVVHHVYYTVPPQGEPGNTTSTQLS